MQKGYIEDSNPKFYDEKDMKDLERFNLLEDDILISLTGNVGRVARVTKEILPAALNQRVASIKPKDIVNNNYLFYMMNSNKFEDLCMNESKGVAQKNLGTTSLSKIKIPVPPMNIQKQIVEVLDQAQNLIDNRKEQIKLLDDLIESIFYDMFGDPVKNDKGWEVEKLEDLCKMRSGGTPTRKEEKYFNGNIPWITTVALDKMHIGMEDAVELITEEAVENSATKKIPSNSLMIGTRVGVGKVAINKVEMCTSQDIVSLLNLEKHFNMQFIYKLLKTFNRYFLTKVRGATIKGINMKVLKDVNLIIPPIILQNQFAEKIDLIQSQEQLLEESLKLLEDNYNSLMQRAFKGQLF